jgi:hypothetical protein
MRTFASSFLSGLLVLLFSACSATTAYITDSRPAERTITVDGKSDDWVGALSMISDGRAEEGFLNDQDVLYVCIMTEDESLRRQIANSGLTVWFDPQGGDKKVLGVKYPLGTPRRERAASPPTEEAGPPPEKPAESEASGLEVLRPGQASPQKMGISDVKGLEIASSTEGGLFVYELKIPLRSSADRPVALGAAPGAKVGIGIEVPKSELRPGSGRPPGGMGGRGGEPGGGRGGGMGGMFGGGRGGGHGMGGGMGRRDMGLDAPKGLKVWTYVKLSGSKVPAATSESVIQ